MKLKGTLTERGFKFLEKGFLPALDKHGKTCQMLFTETEVCLIQTELDADGMVVSARCSSDMVFEEGTYACTSRHNNHVAFQCEVAMVRRVLQAAEATDSTVELKLSNRSMAQGADQQPVLKPFLTFTCTGQISSAVQDVPIPRPFLPAEVDELLSKKEVRQLCPFYLDLQPEAVRIQAVADKMRALGPFLEVSTTKQGHLHLKVVAEQHAASLGTELAGLSVVPESQRVMSDTMSETAEGRLQEAHGRGEAFTATVQVKHFIHSMQSCNLTQPTQILCGLCPGFLHFMLVYRNNMSDDGYDKDLGLTYKLPVRVDEE